MRYHIDFLGRNIEKPRRTEGMSNNYVPIKGKPTECNAQEEMQQIAEKQSQGFSGFTKGG